MIGKLDQALGFHEAALRLRSERQQVLASNIANADTPNFKARDIDFSQALQNAVAARPARPPRQRPAWRRPTPATRPATAR